MSPYVTEEEERGPRRQLILTAVVLGLAVALRILPPAPQQRVASFFRGTVLFPFVLVQETLAQASVHAATTEELQARIDSLTASLANQSGLVEENRRLRALLRLGPRMGARYAPASVIRSGTSMSESSFVLDVGTVDGVGEDVTVMTGQGLLGVVTSVNRRRATAMDWTHPTFRVSAMTADETTSGMVRAERPEFGRADRLRLDGVPFHQRLEPGTLILTNGLGGVHPRGIPLGWVEEEATEEQEQGEGWRRSYWVRPAVDPGNATHVLVLVDRSEVIPDLSPVFRPDSTAAGPVGVSPSVPPAEDSTEARDGGGGS